MPGLTNSTILQMWYIFIENDPTGYQEVNDYSDEPKLFIELSNISLKLFMETIDTVMIDQ